MMGDENPMSSNTGAVKKKKDEKARRRDQRSWDNIMRSISNMSEGEKIAVIQEKYNEVYNDFRKISATLVSVEKQYAILQKERDHTQTELTKNILAKAKLESLCRELQKHNKVIKEENITRVKEEEEKRREVATSFTEKLNSLTTLMDENKDKSVRLREENMSMTAKLTELYDQFQEREGNLANMNRQMDLQKQLSETQLQKLQVERENERKLFEQERQALTASLERSEENNRVLQANVQSLQDHIDIYRGQYSDFENTMAKSTRVFDAFKSEMTTLQQANTTLEQERNEYLARWQSCTNSVVQITELHQQTLNELKVYERKMPLLERICRQLQAERSAYQKQLQEHNITPVYVPQAQDDQTELPHPCASTSTAPPTTLSHTAQKKLTKKERLLVALKSELKTMEDQLKIATRQQEAAKDNQEAAARRQEMERAIAAQKLQISLLEAELHPAESPSEPAPASQPVLPVLPVLPVPSPRPGSATRPVSYAQPNRTSPQSEKVPQIKLKLVKSVPLTAEDQKRSSGEPAKSGASSSSSAENLLADLSLEAIPLYKAEAVTDIHEMEEICLVRESEAFTDLLQTEECHYGQGDHRDVAIEENEGPVDKSGTTIPLKQSDAKTDLSEF